MSVETAFDQAAVGYDESFTHSSVGSLQRKRVYYWLSKWGLLSGKTVLEINCGTGEDVRRFTEAGNRITATDISAEMIRITRQKNPGVVCECLDLKHALGLYTDEHNLIFSNFGGLNCLSPEELERFIDNCGRIQKTNDRLAWVIMPGVCLMEDLYFLVKFRWRNMFRRRRKNVVKVGTQTVDTWYYSPRHIRRRLCEVGYTNVRVRPVASFIPPSYMAERLKSGGFLLNVLYGLETVFGRIPFVAGISDHYIITAEKV